MMLAEHTGSSWAEVWRALVGVGPGGQGQDGAGDPSGGVAGTLRLPRTDGAQMARSSGDEPQSHHQPSRNGQGCHCC